jgi:hypothetical protein
MYIYMRASTAAQRWLHSGGQLVAGFGRTSRPVSVHEFILSSSTTTPAAVQRNYRARMTGFTIRRRSRVDRRLADPQCWMIEIEARKNPSRSPGRTGRAERRIQSTAKEIARFGLELCVVSKCVRSRTVCTHFICSRANSKRPYIARHGWRLQYMTLRLLTDSERKLCEEETRNFGRQ